MFLQPKPLFSLRSTVVDNVHRNYRNDPQSLMFHLTEIDKRRFGQMRLPVVINPAEAKYRDHHYNGSFHKTLPHNLRDGRLINPEAYEEYRRAIIENDQAALNNIPLAPGSTMKPINPLASHCTIVNGPSQQHLEIESAPFLSSPKGGAEILEIYAMALARDVAFVNYHESQLITSLLQPNTLNNLFVLSNLNHSPSSPTLPLTSSTIFRSAVHGAELGPYISQFLYKPVRTGALITEQKYISPPSRTIARLNNIRTEWGVTLSETINIQNGNLSLNPPTTPSSFLHARYINNGFSLAEAVHNDPPYQFFYQAGAILAANKYPPNRSWPVYANQNSFITSNGIAAVLCEVASIANLALKHAWYHKWQEARNLRPEAYGLWIHDVKADLVENAGNFDIPQFVLENAILEHIRALNGEWNSESSYTLPLTYPEGSPVHPAFPSGHATIAGACATILKCFFDCEQKWLQPIVHANQEGSELITFIGETDQITVGTELNKLAANVAYGRNFAGVHYRSDAEVGMHLGEKVAIHYVEHLLSTMVENYVDGSAPIIRIRRFDGEMIEIKPSIGM